MEEKRKIRVRMWYVFSLNCVVAVVNLKNNKILWICIYSEYYNAVYMSSFRHQRCLCSRVYYVRFVAEYQNVLTSIL